MRRKGIFKARVTEVDYSVFDERWRTPSGMTLEEGAYYVYQMMGFDLHVISEACESVAAALECEVFDEFA